MILLILAGALTSGAEAKTYNSCEAAFARYHSDKTPHKAFATTNGSMPGHGDMACGGSSGNDLGRVSYEALTRCASEARKNHFSGKCRIIRKQ